MREVELGPGKRLLIHEDSGDGEDAKTGGCVWDCSLVLANWFGRVCFSSSLPKESFASLLGLSASGFLGKRVVELGAGTGLPGLAAAMLGAKEVVLTDKAPLLPLLRKNVLANALDERVRVEELEWGQDCSPLQPPFDFVLCSDVIYDGGFMAPLAKTMVELCGENGRAVVAYELRQGAGDCFNVLRESGLRWNWVPKEELHPDWQSDDIGVFVMRRAPG